MSALVRPSQTINGRHVLVAMLAFFFIVIAVNAGFIVLAVRSFPGEDERRSYLQGLHYNETLARRAAQAQLQWSAEARIAPASPDASDFDALVIFEVRDREGSPVQGLQVAGVLRRPTTTREDTRFVFREVQPGRYEAPARIRSEGAWIIQGEARRGGEAFAFERRLTWSRQQSR